MNERGLERVVSDVVHDVESSAVIDDIYVVGSRGAVDGNVTEESDLDVLVSIERADGYRGEELAELCDVMGSRLWNEEYGAVLSASGLGLAAEKRNLDVDVCPVFATPVELSRKVEFGGYETVYSVLEGRHVEP